MKQICSAADAFLDTSGLMCPLPVLKARKALNGLSPGQTLEIVATDPGSVLDFEAFCKAGNHTLASHHAEGGTHRFLIVRGEQRPRGD